MKRLLTVFLIVSVGIPSLASCYFWLTSADIRSLPPPLQNGDLVFQTSDSGQTLAIWMASGSLYTHMGIIKIGADGTPFVIEAAGTVREIPLKDWIKRGWFGRLTVARVRGLTPKYAQKVLEEAKKYYGKPYDVFFLPGEDQIYCSELVHLSFKGATGAEIGRMQSFRELEYHNSAVQSLILSRWEKYPPCINKGIDDLDECLLLIYEQKLVTPISIANDRRMETLYSNY